MGGYALFARWITDFDCGYKTSWWNVILDSPFDISSLKSKRRYEIKKGEKSFIVKVCKLSEYYDQLFDAYMEAKNGMPKYLQNKFNLSYFDSMFTKQENEIIFGAFSKESKKLKGFALFRKVGRYIGFIGLRCSVEEEKNNINFALIYYALNYFENDLKSGCYIDDGARAISHTTTNFQDFLEKYFCFRKAYSLLHVKYRGCFGVVVKILFPFRKLFKNHQSGIINAVYAVLLQEEIRRLDENRV